MAEYQKHQTRRERQVAAREIRAKLNIPKPLPNFNGQMPPSRKQIAWNLIGPVYPEKKFYKFLAELTKKGRVIPDFYQITSGPNKGSFREIGDPVNKLITHY
jgi:hypothetical protein